MTQNEKLNKPPIFESNQSIAMFREENNGKSIENKNADFVCFNHVVACTLNVNEQKAKIKHTKK